MRLWWASGGALAARAVTQLGDAAAAELAAENVAPGTEMRGRVVRRPAVGLRRSSRHLSRTLREGHTADLPMLSAAGGRSLSVIHWLLDSDPSIRWQVLRDLTDAPADEVAAERAKVATQGAGARLLALQGADGTWGGAAWNRGWDSTMHVLMLLRDLGLDPASDP